MTTRTTIKNLVLAATIGLSATLASAGPQDQFTKYRVDITVLDTKVTAIADTGGTTSISFADAKRMGLLNANGDPADPDMVDRSQRVGGTGGGALDCWVFNNIFIDVTPRKADGTPNGPKRTIKVSVLVPKKPSLQAGANDAEKQRKTNSMPTKIGGNVCGATIDGHKLDFTDEDTNDPKKNNRSTGWRAVNGGGGGGGGGDRRAPVEEDDHYEDEVVFEPHLLDVIINGEHIPQMVQMNLGPITCMGQQAAQQLGLEMMEPEFLDFENHQLLYVAGLTDILPDPNNQLLLPMGIMFLELPTLEGQPMENFPVRTFVLPDGDPFAVVMGGNALVPPQTSMWLDSDSNQLFWDLDFGGCLGDFNNDGVVNTLDVLDFLNAWSSQDPAADVNNDGVVNTLDVIDFLNAWSNGCN